MTILDRVFNRPVIRVRALSVALLCGAGLCGLCASARTLSVTDDTGAQIAVPAPPLRIASLAPSATALLFAAGAGAQVIATTEYSLEPPAAGRIARLGDASALDLERLVALHPDVVIAWPDGENPAETARIGRLGIPVYREKVERLADLGGSIRRLGELAGTRAAAERAAAEIDARLAALTRRYAQSRQVTVLLQVWARPIYTIGGPQPVSDALRTCGARNIFRELREPAPAVGTEAVIARNPELITAVGSRREGERWLAMWKRFPALRAVRTGELITFDDQRLTRLGPGMLDATQALCERIDQARREIAARR